MLNAKAVERPKTPAPIIRMLDGIDSGEEEEGLVADMAAEGAEADKSKQETNPMKALTIGNGYIFTLKEQR